MKKVAIIGSGTLAQHIAHYLHTSSKYAIHGFYDDFRIEGEETSYGKIKGNIERLKRNFKKNEFEELVIAIGYNHLKFRSQIFEEYANTIPFTTFIHPTCYVDSSCTIGQGVIMLPNCVIDKDVVIGNNNFFNIGCSIAHDTKIGNNNFFGPSVSLAGFVKIDQSCFIGIGTTAIDNVSICAYTQTGAGSVITKSVTSPGLYAGVPAKFIK